MASHSALTGAPVKTVSYYTHSIALPTTLKQVLLLPDPLLVHKCIENDPKIYTPKSITMCIQSVHAQELTMCVQGACSQELINVYTQHTHLRVRV